MGSLDCKVILEKKYNLSSRNFQRDIMLLNLNTQSEPHKSTWLKFAAAITSGLLLVILVGTLKGSETMVMPVGNPNAGLIKNLGNTLFKDFLLPFEVSSILFLVA